VQFDELREEVVYDLRHEHTIAEVACNILLRSIERDGVDPTIEVREGTGLELAHRSGRGRPTDSEATSEERFKQLLRSEEQ
jgi:hypothetical protein